MTALYFMTYMVFDIVANVRAVGAVFPVHFSATGGMAPNGWRLGVWAGEHKNSDGHETFKFPQNFLRAYTPHDAKPFVRRCHFISYFSSQNPFFLFQVTLCCFNDITEMFIQKSSNYIFVYW